MLDVSVKGIATTSEGGYAVILEGEKRMLPVFIGADQARSIHLALEDRVPPRPLTHDLFIEVVNEMGGAFDRLIIDDLKDGTYYGKLYIEVYKDGKQELVFDVRPSDGIALMTRVNGPVKVSGNVIDEAGIDEDELDLFE